MSGFFHIPAAEEDIPIRIWAERITGEKVCLGCFPVWEADSAPGAPGDTMARGIRTRDIQTRGIRTRDIRTRDTQTRDIRTRDTQIRDIRIRDRGDSSRQPRQRATRQCARSAALLSRQVPGSVSPAGRRWRTNASFCPNCGRPAPGRS